MSILDKIRIAERQQDWDTTYNLLIRAGFHRRPGQPCPVCGGVVGLAPIVSHGSRDNIRYSIRRCVGRDLDGNIGGCGNLYVIVLPRSLDYGVLPLPDDLRTAFNLTCSDVSHLSYEKVYRVHLGNIETNLMDAAWDITGGAVETYPNTVGYWTFPELWRILRGLCMLYRDGNDVAGEFASDILNTLGFEWI